MKKPNTDGFELHFTGIINSHLEKENRSFAKMFFEPLNGKSVAFVKVNKSPKPVYVRFGGKEEFYIRQGNRSEPLNIREATEYTESLWPQKT